MATIMIQGKRRCDGICHKATGTKCGCICGGKNHGSLVKATDGGTPAPLPEPPKDTPFDVLFAAAEV